MHFFNGIIKLAAEETCDLSLTLVERDPILSRSGTKPNVNVHLLISLTCHPHHRLLRAQAERQILVLPTEPLLRGHVQKYRWWKRL